MRGRAGRREGGRREELQIEDERKYRKKRGSAGRRLG